MNRASGPRRYPVARPVQVPANDEELEFGEPIEGEDEPARAGAKKKIPAMRGKFNGQPPARASEDTPAEGSEAQGGRVVLASAKYLTPDAYNTDTPENRKKLAQQRKAQEAKEARASGGQSLEGKVFHSGFWGGLLAMTVAVLWFAVGLMEDVIFFYPPILFVIGLGAVFKSGTSSGE